MIPLFSCLLLVGTMELPTPNQPIISVIRDPNNQYYGLVDMPLFIRRPRIACDTSLRYPSGFT